ncbi:MAG: fluoride efflux transporter CrcB [Bryobacterales bacterium]|nr:fluoride efflux transporter CrcB [Bryobacterales bacterium]
MMDKFLWVFLGAGLGGAARYFVSVLIILRYLGPFPLATFSVNIAGSFLIGIFMTLFTNQYPHHENLRLFLVTGILGGFTTFSSLEWELLQTARFGARSLALFYLASSVAAGYAAVWLGAVLARRP